MQFQKGHPKPKNAYKFPKGHKINVGKNNAFKNKIVYGKCVICGEDIKSFKSKPRKTCSKKCKYELISRGLKGNKRAFKNGIPYDIARKSTEYKKWRMAVFVRDNFTCQFCYTRGIPLEAHHIKTWKKHPELRFVVDNGITLCIECHKLIHSK